MKAYITYLKLKFITGLQYRSAALAGISTQFFFGFVYIMVYVAFYESGSGSVPMPLSSLITYVWLNQAFFLTYLKLMYNFLFRILLAIQSLII